MIAALPAVALAATAALVSSPAPTPTPSVGAYAATSTRAVVTLVDATGVITVSTSYGTVLARTPSLGYATAVSVWGPPGTRLYASGPGWKTSAVVGPLRGSMDALVNKRTPVSPVSYVPSLVPVELLYLNPTAARAYGFFKAGAAKAGVPVALDEAYRSYAMQTSEYNSIVNRLGRSRADTLSARPGYSEHQLGLAMDIRATNRSCTQQACFADTGLGRWAAANAWRYGFILRYNKGANATTGYDFEPWHFRYVGQAVSMTMHQRGIADYESFVGAPKAPGY